MSEFVQQRTATALPGVAPEIAPVPAVESTHLRRLEAVAVVVRARGGLTAVLVVAAVVRFWHLAALGLNSDEAVYTGTSASIAGDATLRSMFPIFRAHPVLVQLIVAPFMGHGADDLAARAVVATLGVLTVAMTYVLAARVFGTQTALLAAGLLAVLPYHVVVTRQMLLDGPMTLGTVVALYCVVRYCETSGLRWMVATGAAMGTTMLVKETSAVLFGALYAFFVLTPAIRSRVVHIVAGLVTTGVIVSAYPIVLSLSGRAATGQHYFLWQIFRRANHPRFFYFTDVPGSFTAPVLLAAFLGLLWLRRESTWRERLLIWWMIVPVAFFTLWPVKGYQYLLPLAPVIAMLAARCVVRLVAVLTPRATFRQGARVVAIALPLALVAWPAISTVQRVQPSNSTTFLAGSGGVPGGREAGLWLATHAPKNATLLTIGPSMANILQFYGRIPARALSVSPSAGNRNPSYVPVRNPDAAMRAGQFQYLVWDSFTAARTSTFSSHLQELVQKFHGVAVFTATVDAGAEATPVPVVIVYQVRAA